MKDKRFIAIELDFGGCYYEGDTPDLKVTFCETIEEAKKTYPHSIIDLYTGETQRVW